MKSEIAIFYHQNYGFIDSLLHGCNRSTSVEVEDDLPEGRKSIGEQEQRCVSKKIRWIQRRYDFLNLFIYFSGS